MNEKIVRVYRKLDIHDVREHLLIYGDLSASCSKCKALDIKFETLQCPQCHTAFKYVSFRNVKQHLPKLQKLLETRPEIILVDFEDYSRLAGALKAEEFLQ